MPEDVTSIKAWWEWRPIETAPKDGTPVFGYDPHGVEVPCEGGWPENMRLNAFPMIWDDKEGWITCMTTVDFGVCDDPSTDFFPVWAKPTHWMPLPPKPTEARTFPSDDDVDYSYERSFDQ